MNMSDIQMSEDWKRFIEIIPKSVRPKLSFHEIRQLKKALSDYCASKVEDDELMDAISNAYGFLWHAEGDRRHNQAFDMSCRAREILLCVMEKADQKKGIDYSAGILGATQDTPPQSVEDDAQSGGVIETVVEIPLDESGFPLLLQSVDNDEVVERLRVLSNDGGIQSMTLFDNELGPIPVGITLDAAITRLQSQSANPWVKIEDIPEEWKDGRDILAYNPSNPPRHSPFFITQFITHPSHMVGVMYRSNNVTHAMLPIAAPKT